MPLLLSVVAQRRVTPSPGACWMPDPSPATGPTASGCDRQLGGHAQTREVSPLMRAAVRSLHAGQGYFFHTAAAIHRLAVGPGLRGRRDAELGVCVGWLRFLPSRWCARHPLGPTTAGWTRPYGPRQALRGYLVGRPRKVTAATPARAA